MRYQLQVVLVLALPLTFFTISPKEAEACSAPPCWQSYLAPANDVYVPANLPAIYWQPARGYDASELDRDPSRVQLAGSVPVPSLTESIRENGDVLFLLNEPLVEGQSYRLTDSTTCNDSSEFISPDNSFTATAEAALPSTLGTVSAIDKGLGPLHVATTSGSCSTQIEAHQIALEVELSDDAQPWRDVLAFTTLVDGQPWAASESINSTNAPGTSWVGRAKDKVFLSCDSDSDEGYSGLAEGAHLVAFEALLPGTDIVLSTEPVTVQLSCDEEDTSDDRLPDLASGCSIQRRGRTGTFPLLALLGLFLIPARRRQS